MSELKGGYHLTSSGRRRSRRECLVGRPRSPFAEGVENKLPQGVPRRGLVVRPTAAWSPLAPPLPRPRLHTSAACRRAGRRPSVSRPLVAVALRCVRGPMPIRALRLGSRQLRSVSWMEVQPLESTPAVPMGQPRGQGSANEHLPPTLGAGRLGEMSMGRSEPASRRGRQWA